MVCRTMTTKFVYFPSFVCSLVSFLLLVCLFVFSSSLRDSVHHHYYYYFFFFCPVFLFFFFFCCIYTAQATCFSSCRTTLLCVCFLLKRKPTTVFIFLSFLYSFVVIALRIHNIYLCMFVCVRYIL